MPQLALSLLLLLMPLHLTHSFNHLIVWNVGQGQWVTVSLPSQCLHFDTGGERFHFKNTLMKFCRKKNNQIYITHWDRDHYSYLKRALRILWPACLATPGKVRHNRKCKANDYVTKIFAGGIRGNRNDNSLVFLIMNKFLIPGDATKKSERLWSYTLKEKKIEYLLVGHHGSQTSTSKTLLNHLPHLKYALVSARHGKYGHPHASVTARLKQKKVPMITTETFGNLIIEF